VQNEAVRYDLNDCFRREDYNEHVLDRFLPAHASNRSSTIRMTRILTI